MWGATRKNGPGTIKVSNFNPRSPCGERPKQILPFSSLCNFNPRSPCGERLTDSRIRARAVIFQSTLPVWGATQQPSYPSQLADISIHAPRVGSDTVTFWLPIFPTSFQSTLPVWGATCILRSFSVSSFISIHAPRVGSDPTEGAASAEPVNFNPRSPCGERLPSPISAPRFRDFNPRSPCGERPSWILIPLTH